MIYMAVLLGLSGFINEHSNRTKVPTLYGPQMKDICVKAAHHNFKQLKMGGFVPLEETFDRNVVEAYGIDYNKQYYR